MISDFLSPSYFQENEKGFQFLGITLYIDDIIIIFLLLFLYFEGVKDQFLFISLILLLLT